MYSNICIFDYDGTLCAQTDPAVSLEIMEKLRALQIKARLVLATGRPNLLIPEFPEFQWDAAVYYNGQLCVAGNQIIHQQVLEDREWRRFCYAAQQEKLELLSFSDRVITPRLPVRLPCLPDVTGAEFTIGQPLDEEFLYKIIIEPSRSVSALVTRYMPHAQIVKWHPNFWEIVPAGVDKYIGVERILTRMGWRWEQVVAFGDGENDCPLFRRASRSVAIGDQCPALVELATYVAPPLAQKGIEWAIERAMYNGGESYDSNHQ